jgi:intracellular sulfur oxidation DsrE/DsrF family protein
VDAGKAATTLAKLMGLENRDDSKERARSAIRALMDLKQCSPEEAISILAPHNPTVTQLREEFAGSNAIIEITKEN